MEVEYIVTNPRFGQTLAQNLQINHDPECRIVDQQRFEVVTTKRKYTCNYCKETFRRKDALDRHVYHHTNKKTYICSFVNCSQSYTNVAHLRRHVKKSHNGEERVKNVECISPECSSRFTTKLNMKKHYKLFHIIGKTTYICDTCNASFKQKQQLKRHCIEHTGAFPYQCEICGKGLMNEKTYIRHRSSHEHKCDQCQKRFKNWSGFVAHRKISHVLEHRCNQCNKMFHSKSNLKYHQKVHLNKDDRHILECRYEKCSKYYFEKRNLDAHIRSKHEGRKFICGYEECGRQMSTKQKLAQHLKLHLSERDGVKSKTTSCRNSNDILEPRKPRKDKGIQKQSAALLLSGIRVSNEIEKLLIKNQGKQIYVSAEYLPIESSDMSDLDPV